MLRTLRAEIDQNGNVRLLEPITLPGQCQALVTLLEDEAVTLPPTLPGILTEVDGWRALYHPVRVIGRGGMGETHLAIDRATGKVVCVKVLLPAVNVRALLQECRALAKLHHPHIVRLLNFDTSGTAPYLVVEFVQGVNLADYLRRQGALTEPVVVALGVALFDALAYAHERDVLHRDLKPSNVLLEHNGAELLPRIVDFGLAIVDRRDDQGVITAHGHIAGTLAYMAPEQFDGAQLSGACDVYAAGQILWECLSGRAAFEGSWGSIVEAKGRQAEGLAVHDAAWEASSSLAGLIAACTQRDPARRPTARQALEVLRTCGPEVKPPAVVTATNLGFDWPASGALPPGWCNSDGFVADVSTAYDLSVVAHPDLPVGQCARIACTYAAADEFGSLMQRIPGQGLGGRELLLEAEMRTEEVREWAGLWLRIDGPCSTLFFDNMRDRPLRGSTGWSTQRLSVTLPRETTWINYGALLVGTGTVWIDNVRLFAADPRGVLVPLRLWSDDFQPSADVPMT
ncbi:MAG TPA: serine/threonine-protein kinase [Gemmataceae bacterium]|nr:serine/threonine-protein kinase [Gemmataceae bacterium]